MAIDIAFKADVDLGEGAKSIRSLKQEYKEAQKELDGLTVGSKEYINQLQKLGKVKDQIGDLNAEINAFHPEGKIQAFGNVVTGLASGFQAATGAAALFGGESKDVEKALLKVQAVMAFTEGLKGLASLKDGFTVLGNVIKSNPIFLIASIVIGIGTAMFALKDKIAVVGEAFDWIGKKITAVVQVGKDLLDFFGLTEFAAQKTADSIVANSERIKAANNSRYDSEIAAAKRAGKETELIEIAKLSAALKTNDAIIANLKGQSEEEIKKRTELRAENAKYYQDIMNLSDAYKDREIENQKKITEKWIEENKKRTTDREKEQERLRAIAFEYEQDIAKLKSDQAAEEQAQKDKDLADHINSNNAKVSDTQRVSDYNKRIAKEDSEASKQAVDENIAWAKAGNDSMIALSDLYFTLKNRNLKKGSAEELKNAKQQFKINKAFSIASTLISGLQGVVNGLSAPYPQNIIMPILAGITTTASVAKIASTKFEGGSTSIGSLPSAPSGGEVPTINAPRNSDTLLNPDGTVRGAIPQKQQVIKAHVVETEITGTQNRVSSLEAAAKF